MSGDIHLDDDEKWTDNSYEGKKLLEVATHEIGHTLGLGHTSVEGAIMYAFYMSPDIVQLKDDDISGIRKLYGSAPPGKHLPSAFDKPSAPPLTTPPAPPSPPVDPCNVIVDTILLVRGQVIDVFAGEWQWRVTHSRIGPNKWHSYECYDGPHNKMYLWKVLKRVQLERIDAAIEDNHGDFYIFRNRRFWMVRDDAYMVDGFPNEGRPLTDLGLPPYLTHVDTIFRWGHNNALYVMSGDLYWKFIEVSMKGRPGRVVPEPTYPRRISTVWFGVPTPLNAAFTLFNGKTYFIRGKYYCKFDNVNMRCSAPKNTRLAWLGCSKV